MDFLAIVSANKLNISIILQTMAYIFVHTHAIAQKELDKPAKGLTAALVLIIVSVACIIQ